MIVVLVDVDLYLLREKIGLMSKMETKEIYYVHENNVLLSLVHIVGLAKDVLPVVSMCSLVSKF